MQTPLNYIVAFVLAFALLFAGIFLVRNSERVCRICSFGQNAPTRFGVRFFRLAGWFYICGGALGVLMLLLAMLLPRLHSH